jgi:hypothetical protein
MDDMLQSLCDRCSRPRAGKVRSLREILSRKVEIEEHWRATPGSRDRPTRAV